MLLSPANTGLYPDRDYRVGANYRSQWAAVPVPYRTFSAYGDAQLFRGHNEGNSWLGLGAAVFNDKVGDGELSLTRTEAFAAYHVLLGERSMVSLGLSAGYSQRSINFGLLTFDQQWDGFSFSSSMASGESGNTAITSYADFGSGINYAYFPNENVYVKLSAGAAHVNQPIETFYGQENQIGIRPTANLDVTLRTAESIILNPSFFYSRQRNVQEMTYGSLLLAAVDNSDPANRGHLILGAFHRWGDAVIAAAGYEWHGIRALVSYDVNISPLATQVKGNGAYEFALRYQGTYVSSRPKKSMYGCPRF
jgi:type IX secretion system PorP/SprF family membrane protein